MLSKFASSNTASSSRSWTLLSNTITNPKEDLKGITTRSGVAYQGPTIPTSSKVVKQGTKVTKDQVQAPRSQSIAPVQPPVAQSEIQTPVSKPVVAPLSVSMPNLRYSANYNQMTANKIGIICEDRRFSRSDPEEDILLLEAILNSKPLPPFPNHEQYMPWFKKELKVCEAKTVKSFVDKPPGVELKDLPPHLEYVFLEGDNKFPVIIA
nr:hypothetical protein [Tanacetum cinerariifolium]